MIVKFVLFSMELSSYYIKIWTIFSIKFEGLGTFKSNPTKITIKNDIQIIIKLNPNNLLYLFFLIGIKSNNMIYRDNNKWMKIITIANQLPLLFLKTNHYFLCGYHIRY